MIIKRFPERIKVNVLAASISSHSFPLNLPYSSADCYLSETGLSKPATSSLFNVIKGRNRPILQKRISRNKRLSTYCRCYRWKKKYNNKKKRPIQQWDTQTQSHIHAIFHSSNHLNQDIASRES